MRPQGAERPSGRISPRKNTQETLMLQRYSTKSPLLNRTALCLDTFEKARLKIGRERTGKPLCDPVPRDHSPVWSGGLGERFGGRSTPRPYVLP
jgi:hypothetical protein